MYLDEALGEPDTQRSEWIGQLAADEADLGFALYHWLSRIAPQVANDHHLVGADIEAGEYHGTSHEPGHPVGLTLYLVEKSDLPSDGFPGLELDEDGNLPVIRFEVPYDALEDRTFEDVLLESFKRMKLRIAPRGLPVDAGRLKPVDDIGPDGQRHH